MAATRPAFLRTPTDEHSIIMSSLEPNAKKHRRASEGAKTMESFNEDDVEEGEQKPFLPGQGGMEKMKRVASDEAIKTSTRKTWLSSPIWLLATAALLITLIVQNTYLYTIHRHGSYSTGFIDEIAYLKPHIKIQQTRFQGGIHDVQNGSTLEVPNPAVDAQGRRFTGPPTGDIDAAWNNLISGRYVTFTAPEIFWLNSDPDIPDLTMLNFTDNLVPTPGFYGGIDMMHSLHCLNALRMSLDSSYYKDHATTFSPALMRMHMDHCIEQLRQAVLCHGDLTPVTLKPVRNAEGSVWALLGETERVHGCRNGVELARVWKERGGGVIEGV